MKKYIPLILALVFLIGCDSVGDDGPETVDDCPIEVRESRLDGNPNGGYYRDYLFLTVENAGERPILFEEGDMRVKITRPDGSSYTTTQNVCCELTREPYYEPGQRVTILDIPEPEIDEGENVEESEAVIVEQTTLDCKVK